MRTFSMFEDPTYARMYVLGFIPFWLGILTAWCFVGLKTDDWTLLSVAFLTVVTTFAGGDLFNYCIRKMPALPHDLRGALVYLIVYILTVPALTLVALHACSQLGVGGLDSALAKGGLTYAGGMAVLMLILGYRLPVSFGDLLKPLRRRNKR